MFNLLDSAAEMCKLLVTRAQIVRSSSFRVRGAGFGTIISNDVIVDSMSKRPWWQLHFATWIAVFVVTLSLGIANLDRRAIRPSAYGWPFVIEYNDDHMST